MSEVIEFGGKNELGYSHVICCECDYNNTFHVKTGDIDGIEHFTWLVCAKCGNEIPIKLSPVWQ